MSGINAFANNIGLLNRIEQGRKLQQIILSMRLHQHGVLGVFWLVLLGWEAKILIHGVLELKRRQKGLTLTIRDSTGQFCEAMTQTISMVKQSAYQFENKTLHSVQICSFNNTASTTCHTSGIIFSCTSMMHEELERLSG